MFLSLIKIVPIPEKRDTLLGILNSVQRKTKVMPGCTDCVVYEESGNVTAILYLEGWGSREALHRHIRSRLYIRVLHAMDLARQPPDVFFYEVSGQKGLDLIQALRESGQEMQ